MSHVHGEVSGHRLKSTERHIKALVFEPYSSGHRLNYAAVVLEAIATRSRSRVFGTTKDVLGSVEYAEALGPIEGFEIAAPVSGPVTSRQAAQLLVRLEQEHSPDVTLVPTADGIAQWLGWNRLFRLGTGRRHVPRVMLMMRGHNYLRPSAAPYPALKRRLAGIGLRLSGAHTFLALDDELLELLRELPVNASVVRVPEVPPALPVISRKCAREALGITEQARVVGFFGRRDKRKGFDLLIAGLQATTDPSIHLLAMGKEADETTQLFERFRSQPDWANRITSYGTFVSREELNQGMAACDVVALPYREQERSSGILTEAAAACRYVLAADGGWMARTIRQHELGAVANANDPRCLAQGIEQAIEIAPDFRHGSAGNEFVRFNSLKRVRAVWLAAMTEAVNSLHAFRPA